MRRPRGPLTKPWAIVAPILAFALIAIALIGGMEAGTGERGGGPAEGADARDSVVVGHPRAPTSLNRTLAGDPLTLRITAAVADEHLLARTPEGEYVPQLAAEVPVPEPAGEGMAVTFQINPAARWSDGVAVSSRDVAFTWRALTDPDNRITGAGGWAEIVDVATPDPQTAVVAFRRPFAGWRALFASAAAGAHTLLPAHRLAGRGLRSASLDAEGIGTGPYRVAEYVPGERLVLEVAESYWDDAAPRPRVGRIVHLFLEEDELAARMRAGTVDLVSPPDFTAIEGLRAVPGLTIASGPGRMWEHLHFNVRDPVMDDPNVRRAIARAFDPAALIATVGAGAEPLESVLIPEDEPYFVPAWEAVRPDSGEVERLLALAGYRRSSGGEYVRGGRRLTVEIVATRGSALRGRNLAVLAAQLRVAGIAARARVDSGAVLAGRFQIALTAASADADPSLRERYSSDRVPAATNDLSGRNIARIADPGLDALLAAADAELAEPERIRLTHLAQERLAAAMVGRPLYRWPQVVAHRDDLEGVELSPSPLGPFADVTAWSWRAPNR